MCLWELSLYNTLSDSDARNTIQTFGYYLFRSFLSLSALLPLRILHFLAKIWGSLLYRFPNRAKDTTQKNLKACFTEKSANEIDALTRASLINTAATALEMGKSWLPAISKTLRLVVEIEGQNDFNSAYESGSGIVLLAPHLGNWELFGFKLCDSKSATWLYQPPKNPALDRLITRTRSRGGINMAPTNRAGVAQLFKALKQGQLIGVLPDQVPTEEGGTYAPFFGVSAYTMTLVSKLVQRSNARVFCGFAKRLPDAKGFKIIVEEADQEIYSDDVEVSVAALNKSVERSVEKAVEQYQWEYKRFKKQVDGSRFY
ncbi:MAG: lysophospholipid acyltransferase family protein [Gammaproteobacteria bacterium]|nr:lysophospholipid acyltransferase family protein [Gammaproteobacteria bacterium]MDD9897138.1 lysophospholipid acyltransferase family protein [Gammaproteobacteria bacterium]MDD9958067.1 lysophospholipid acyltransferase family protein [Gammaproteobacteria bacterium]